jgi:hypothetical protein
MTAKKSKPEEKMICMPASLLHAFTEELVTSLQEIQNLDVVIDLANPVFFLRMLHHVCCEHVTPEERKENYELLEFYFDLNRSKDFLDDPDMAHLVKEDLCAICDSTYSYVSETAHKYFAERGCPACLETGKRDPKDVLKEIWDFAHGVASRVGQLTGANIDLTSVFEREFKNKTSKTTGH